MKFLPSMRSIISWKTKSRKWTARFAVWSAKYSRKNSKNSLQKQQWLKLPNKKKCYPSISRT